MTWARQWIAISLAILFWSVIMPATWAFCGFYVAKADADLFNQASQVILARDGNRTVLTMANDFQGDVQEFAIVVPVPTVLQQEQVHVGEQAVLDHLDAFTAPRLVEYFDEDPCQPMKFVEDALPQSAPVSQDAQELKARSQGVTIEAKFSVGEYDILILSAKESTGLEAWLTENGYRIPEKAAPLLQPYIKQDMKFFVAKVNLKEFAKTGYQNLRPLQIAYESPKFMLPIRLGMTNAQSAQDLIVYALSPKGQVELTNYRTVKIPSDVQIPLYVKNEFDQFYTSLFKTAYVKEGKAIGFLEYAWNMNWCDPCSADPLTPEELKQAGVFWSNPNAPSDVFVTRLHVRYAREQFPEDLIFQETSNQETFQGRYILRHPFTGQINCSAGREYQKSLPARFDQEAQTLAQLTGWNLEEIRQKLPAVPNSSSSDPWWRTLWP